MTRVRVGDTELHVVDRGQGVPLLLIHGFPLDHTMWSSSIEFFARDYRVIAPDLRGFGRSDVTAGTVTMQRFAGDVRALLDALLVVEPVVYCGLSMGGYIGWEFWRNYAPWLRALVLCDTRAKADTADAIQSRMHMVEQVLNSGTSYVAEAMLPKLLASETFVRLPNVVDFVRQKILTTSPEGIAAALRGMAARPDASDQLAGISCPTMLIVGEQDSITTVAEMGGIAEQIPAAELEMIPQAGHLTPLENPAAFNHAVERFLRKLPA